MATTPSQPCFACPTDPPSGGGSNQDNKTIDSKQVPEEIPPGD